MKRFICTLSALVALTAATFAQNKTAKLSPLTQNFLSAQKSTSDAAGRVPNYNYKLIDNRWFVSSLIKVNPDVDESRLNLMGVKIGTKAGSIWTAQIPVDSVVPFTQVAGLNYIQLDVPIIPTLDSARRQTHADSVHRGINLPSPVAGRNVIVGVIDAGFDYTNPTFYDTTFSQYRIKRIWAQKTTGTPPSGFTYGKEYTDSNLMRSAGYDTIITSHGSHVAGIAAGSGHATNSFNNKCKGFAYESDLVMVGIMPAPSQWMSAGESDIIDGMSYIYNYAASAGKPAVVNLSWGSTLGPHDGRSLFSEACDALTGPGKIFVCAAGNNGEDTVHLQKIFSAIDTTVSTFVTYSPYLDTNHLETWVDMWGDSTRSFCVNVKLYNGSTAYDSTGFICLSDTTLNYSLVGGSHDTCHVTITTITTDYNGKPHAFIKFQSHNHDNICLTTKATAGTVNMWEGYVFPPSGYYGALKKLGYTWAVSGDTKMTVSDIGCTKSAITVGAYTSKTGFINISGAGLYYPGALKYRIAPFSSIGPTADNRVKPDITAPGFGVVSAISSYDTTFNPTGSSYSSVIGADTIGLRTYRYAIFAGTSMASPCASGVVAMMLQLSPALTPDSVKTILKNTALLDIFTGALPPAGNNTWGHGKLNAYGAVRFLAHELEVESLNFNPQNCLIYPNPSNGTFNVDYNSTCATQLTVTISDIAGHVVDVQQWSVTNGSNSKQFDKQTLSKGTYFIRVATDSGYTVSRLIIE